MVENICMALVALASIAFSAWKEFHHNKERNQLIDRLMCRDLAEYQRYHPSRPLASKESPLSAGIRSDEELAKEEVSRLQEEARKMVKAGKITAGDAKNFVAMASRGQGPYDGMA